MSSLLDILHRKASRPERDTDPGRGGWRQPRPTVELRLAVETVPGSTVAITDQARQDE